MFKKRDRNEVRVIRHARVRKKISGTPEMPRLCVYRSNKYIYAQVIDDTKGITLVQASSLDPALKGQLDEVDKSGEAKLVGKLVAERAKQAGVERWSLTAAAMFTLAVWPLWLPAPVKRALSSKKEATRNAT